MGPENTEDLLMRWTPMSCKGKVQQIKPWLQNQRLLSEDQKQKLAKGRTTAQWKLHKPPQARICANKCQKRESTPKEQSEVQAKGKGKGKMQVEQILPTELQNLKEREHSHGQCVQYGKNSDGIQKQGGGKN
ncbi:hypothetical protein O181_032259 [Austropuccinia psidii MF-1]|uniref:Uncharacterized protein n=1 Tax=Austropuccinia psidii MF-1 TaxID=1389203 RepID=A0A9Q3CX42_9BASI|nr:hypothetical protein [Austropuccinia psidii MF-1]